MIAKEVMAADYIKVDANDSVSSVFGKLGKARHSTALVFDGKKYKGVFSQHRIITSRIDPKGMKAGKMMKAVPILKGDEDLKETARLIYASNMPLLPVAEKGRVLGVVKAIDVVDNLDEKNKRKPVKDVATIKLIVTYENDETATAMRTMFNNAVDRLPVVDRNGSLLGIVSLHNILTHFLLAQQSKSEARSGRNVNRGTRTTRAYGMRDDIRALPVKDFATPVVATAAMDDSVGAIIDSMKEHGISSIVVVEGEKAIGIVTIRDLLELFLKENITY